MTSFDLQISANLTNVTTLQPPKEWSLQFVCATCGSRYREPVLLRSESAAGHAGSGVKVALSCGECKATGSIRLSAPKGYPAAAADTWETVAALDCDQFAPVEVVEYGLWTAEGPGASTISREVELSTGTWCEGTAAITDLRARVVEA